MRNETEVKACVECYGTGQVGADTCPLCKGAGTLAVPRAVGPVVSAQLDEKTVVASSCPPGYRPLFQVGELIPLRGCWLAIKEISGNKLVLEFRGRTGSSRKDHPRSSKGNRRKRYGAG